MKTKLSVKDYIFLTAALLADSIDTVSCPLRIFSSENFYDYGLGKLPKPSNVYNSIRRSLKTGEIEKQLVNGEAMIRLTRRGNQKISADFPLLSFQNKAWDNKWRLALFDISEKRRSQRDLFRIKLKELGFGMIQKSVWLSPHNITAPFKEYLEYKKLEQDVYLLEVDRLLFGDPKSLAEKVWPVWEILHNYRNLLEKLNTQEENKGKIIGEYFGILLTDPFLPREFLPKEWPHEIHKKIKSLIKSQLLDSNS